MKNAVSPDMPGYLVSNADFNIRASSNPRAQLSTSNGMPGTMKVREIRKLELEGRSPLKSAAETTRVGKRKFPGYRIAMSKDFPDFPGFIRERSNSPPRSGSPGVPP